MELNYILWAVMIVAFSTFAFTKLFRGSYVIGKLYLVPAGPLKGPSHFLPVTLSEVTQISADTKIFRFKLPDENQPLGLPIGNHITFKAKISTPDMPEGKDVKRKYTPTSPLNEEGYFDVPIKIYYKNESTGDPGGVMTQYLDTMKLGDTIDISGPRGKLTYLGRGQFQFQKNDKSYTRKIKNLGLIAGGTGITPCFQIIQYVATTKYENLNISLIYANKTENDILLRNMLEEFVADHRLKMYLTLDNPPTGWTLGKGYISQDMISTHIPPPAEDTLILHCGPSPMNRMVRKYLEEMGYKDYMVLKF